MERVQPHCNYCARVLVHGASTVQNHLLIYTAEYFSNCYNVDRTQFPKPQTGLHSLTVQCSSTELLHCHLIIIVMFVIIVIIVINGGVTETAGFTFNHFMAYFVLSTLPRQGVMK